MDPQKLAGWRPVIMRYVGLRRDILVAAVLGGIKLKVPPPGIPSPSAGWLRPLALPPHWVAHPSPAPGAGVRRGSPPGHADTWSRPIDMVEFRRNDFLPLSLTCRLLSQRTGDCASLVHYEEVLVRRSAMSVEICGGSRSATGTDHHKRKVFLATQTSPGKDSQLPDPNPASNPVRPDVLVREAAVNRGSLNRKSFQCHYSCKRGLPL